MSGAYDQDHLHRFVQIASSCSIPIVRRHHGLMAQRCTIMKASEQKKRLWGEGDFHQLLHHCPPAQSGGASGPAAAWRSGTRRNRQPRRPVRTAVPCRRPRLQLWSQGACFRFASNPDNIASRLRPRLIFCPADDYPAGISNAYYNMNLLTADHTWVQLCPQQCCVMCCAVCHLISWLEIPCSGGPGLSRSADKAARGSSSRRWAIRNFRTTAVHWI